MRAEILAIGDELVSGHRVDTNSAWLAQNFRSLGVSVARHATVGDQLDELVTTIGEMASRADIVVSTGGLGPTQDDLTRAALAEAAGRPLVTDESMVARIRNLFARRGRRMPESNRVQAQKPPESDWILNPHGTAPGIDLTFSSGSRSCRWFALPGVPAEMREMWQQSVAPAIRGHLPHAQAIVVEELRCFGIGESSLEAKLPRALLRGGNPEIGITVSRGTITLRVTARGTTHQDAADRLRPVVTELEQALGSLIFGRGQDELHDVVVRELRRRQETLVTLEGPSNGLLAHWLLKADSDGEVFRGGEVIPDRVHAQGEDGVAVPLGEQLEAYRQRARATMALGISRAAGERDAAQLVIISPVGEYRKTISLKAHPDIVADLTAKRALDFLRREARGERGEG